MTVTDLRPYLPTAGEPEPTAESDERTALLLQTEAHIAEIVAALRKPPSGWRDKLEAELADLRRVHGELVALTAMTVLAA